MMGQGERLIFHIDVNSAFLSWECVYRLSQDPEALDLRTIASAVGGDAKSRHGIVLAKSPLARKYGVTTGEPLVQAMRKCPELVVVPSRFDFYIKCSRRMMELLEEYTPDHEKFSIDEIFLDMTSTIHLFGSPLKVANEIRERIKKELGFTVNIGISTNKLLAKMASEFQKPDQVHTLFTGEIERKMWPLPVSRLFWAGPATVRKLGALGIRTIGELAVMDLELLKRHLKKQGEFIWNYANGRDVSPFLRELPRNKGYGNSMTTPCDVTDRETAGQVILSLTETVCARLRADGMEAACVGISITDREFFHSSRQTTLISATDTTLEIYEAACSLFDSLWNHSPIRQIGVHTGKVSPKGHYQYQLFDKGLHDKYSRLDTAVDEIRKRYGEDCVQRAVFMGNQISHMSGGIDKVKRTGVTKAV